VDKSTGYLLESQIGRFVLAGGTLDDVGEESAHRMDVSCSRKVRSSCLKVNPPAG